MKRRKGQFYLLAVIVLLLSFGHLLSSLGGNLVFDLSKVMGNEYYLINFKITRDIELLNSTCTREQLDIYVPWYMSVVAREYSKRGVVIKWFYGYGFTPRVLEFTIASEDYYLEKELKLK